jgi:L-rhamnose-H+ transport protein
MLPVALAVLSGVCFGSWSLALKRKRFELNSFFTVFFATTFAVVLAGCFIADAPGIAGDLGRGEQSGLAWGVGGGLGWGVATLTFGYALTLVGLALGYAIILGIGMVFGTSMSMMLTYGTMGGLPESQVTYGIAGMLIALTGTVLSSWSGSLRSGGFSGEKNFKKGIPVCILSGFLSGLFAVGYGGARLTLGAWTTVLLLTAGFWAAQLLTVCVLRGRGVHLTISSSCALLSAAGGTVFALGVLFHYASADAVGVHLSYPMMMGIQILTGNLWSLALGEWRGAPRRALAVQAIAILLLLLASAVIGRAMMGG